MTDTTAIIKLTNDHGVVNIHISKYFVIKSFSLKKEHKIHSGSFYCPNEVSGACQNKFIVKYVPVTLCGSLIISETKNYIFKWS